MEKAVNPLKELLTVNINRGQLKLSRAAVLPQLGAMRDGGDKQVGTGGVVHTVIHPFWPASLGFE